MKERSTASKTSYLYLLCSFFSVGFLLCQPLTAFASGSDSHGDITHTFLGLALLLIAAKIGGSVEKLRQPAVLGELLAGVMLGNLSLLGIDFVEPFKTDVLIHGLAQIGVVLLLFQVGLESELQTILKVGPRAFSVASVGVILPFLLGAFLLGPLLLPNMSSNAYLFLGATLTATSVGITARVFRDFNKLDTDEAQIVLGAAVIDDVLGLIILAVVSALVSAGSVSAGAVFWITAKAVIFLTFSVILGRLLAPRLSRAMSRVSSDASMKLTVAVSFAFLMSYLAGSVGLAPIVGAFAAGIVLDPVHFRTFNPPQLVEAVRANLTTRPEIDRSAIERTLTEHEEAHVEHLIEPIAHLLTPLFFVVTGMAVQLEVLNDTHVILTALGVTFGAIVGKVLAGAVAGNVNKLIVGVGMIPRGEVGLIFATTGRGLGVVTNEEYAVIVLVVMLTTLLPPPVLAKLLRE